MLKVELHAHTDEDPADRIGHRTEDLIDRAAALGYHALAVTLHDRYFEPAPFRAYAEARGILLLPGIERTIQGKHLLLINFPPEVAAVSTFAEVRALKARTRGLVVAPHPFYPVPSAIGRLLDREPGLVDAIEINAMYTRRIDFNRAAIEWARVHRHPLVGNSDLHLLEQMGTTYSLVDAEPTPDAICDAIRAGRVEVRRSPLTLSRAARVFVQMSWHGLLGRYGPHR
ncbi:MAG: PHP-associated domain-containing protein [Vicinamibacterales bacterium]